MVEPPAPSLHGNRATGEIRARFVATGARTGVARLFQGGGLRVRCPRVAPGLVPDCEAVIINTAGGMMGGDRASIDIAVEAGAAVTLTTQSAEKLYRSTGSATTIATRLSLGPGARLEWLPQETILFDRARVERRLFVDVASDASLLVAECVVFGRLAMGEVMREGSFTDRWEIRRGGALVFAEAVALGPDVLAALDRPALGGGARAVATLLLVAPDAEHRLAAVRDALGPFGTGGGASAWNGLLVARLASPSPVALRAAIVAVLAALRGRSTPRVWQ